MPPPSLPHHLIKMLLLLTSLLACAEARSAVTTYIYPINPTDASQLAIPIDGGPIYAAAGLPPGDVDVLRSVTHENMMVAAPSTTPPPPPPPVQSTTAPTISTTPSPSSSSSATTTTAIIAVVAFIVVAGGIAAWCALAPRHPPMSFYAEYQYTHALVRMAAPDRPEIAVKIT